MLRSEKRIPTTHMGSARAHTAGLMVLSAAAVAPFSSVAALARNRLVVNVTLYDA
jgi:hypothetical protein